MTKPRKPSALYRYIEDVQADEPWGSMLDAGTGVNSLSWVSGLKTDQWTAVTGSASEASWVQEAMAGNVREQDRIIEGNWASPALLTGEMFDTVLADYLLGAIEGFAPYFQSYLFARLRPLTKKRLYATGLEPYVPTHQPDTHAGRLIWEIGRLRDACVLLAGRQPYREYPAEWLTDALQRSGFRVVSLKHFKIAYKRRFVDAQIDICLRSLNMVTDAALASSLKARADALQAEAHSVIQAEGALRHCRNYVVVAKPV